MGQEAAFAIFSSDCPLIGQKQWKQSNIVHVHAKERKHQLLHPVSNVRAQIREENLGSGKISYNYLFTPKMKETSVILILILKETRDINIIKSRLVQF